MNWQLQDAKNQFSKVVRQAQQEGPQTVTLRGERTAVVLSVQDYDALRAAKPTFVDALLDGPAWDDAFVESVNARNKTPSRDPVF